MIHAKKSLGQNFLSDPNILAKIADAAALTKGDTVLEIGPGTGNLTRIVAERAGTVIAVEKDHRLIAELQAQFPDQERIKIIEEDVLKFSPESYKLTVNSYKVVGNIPYYITSHLIRTIFEKWPRPQIIVLTVQKEVAQRMVAQAPHTNLLALSVQFYAEVQIVAAIKKGSFRPMPKVDSAVIRITPKATLPAIDPQRFFTLVRAGFAAPRKQLANNLKTFVADTAMLLEKCGLAPTIRPAELSTEQWLCLARQTE